MMKLMRNKKAQNTAEYAILIALVIGGVVAMQTYAQRALQGRIRDASIYMKDQTSQSFDDASDNGIKLGTTLQYEPYYTNTTAETTKDGVATTHQDGKDATTNVSKAESRERTEYDKVKATIDEEPNL